MKTGLLLPLALLALAGCQGDDDSGTAPTASGTIKVLCGRLIDGISDEVRENQLVFIRDGRIQGIRAAMTELPEGTLALHGYTCLPGLIDTHVHIALKPEDSSDMTVYYRRTPGETTAISEENAISMLEAGFTTVRNVGDYFPDVVLDMKQREERGEVRSPRIQTAGPYMTIPGGGGDLVIPGVDEETIPAGSRLGVAQGPEDFAAKTEAAIDAGADMIKVIASGAVFAFGGVPGAPEMTPDEIAAVVEVAHAHGLRVTAHAHSAQSIKDAVLAGVDSIEHASLADDESIQLAFEHGVAFSMDVYNGTYTAEVGEEAGYPDEFMRKNDETTETQRVAFEKAYALGVPILFGTDAGVLPHGMNARQFSIMVDRGMSEMDAIHSATSVAAEQMDLADDVGAVEAGRYGDLIAVKGDPLSDITLLEDVAIVIKNGNIEKQAADL